MSTRHAIVPTALGDLLVVACQDIRRDAIVGVYFPDHTYPPDPSTIGEPVNEVEDPLISQASSEIREYLSRERRAFEVSTETQGDEFSERVWQRLRAIPYGATTTYGTIARELGNAALAQRVGQAVGHNPLSIVIPCHRVLGADGSLTGFAGGLERKRALLTLEEPDAADTDRLF